MESVSCLHVELLELVLCSGHSVWVVINDLQVLKCISRVFIWVHRFALKSGYAVLVSFSITATGHIGSTKLGGVIVIMISLKFLGHQKECLARNMQSPTYNKKYATSIPSLKDKSSQSTNAGEVLNLLLTNKEYDFGLSCLASWLVGTLFMRGL